MKLLINTPFDLYNGFAVENPAPKYLSLKNDTVLQQKLVLDEFEMQVLIEYLEAGSQAFEIHALQVTTFAEITLIWGKCEQSNSSPG